MIYQSVFNSKKWTIVWLLSLNFIFYSVNISAQINAYVGYVYSQNKDTKILNNIIGRYNMRNPTLLSPMSTLKNLHGVDLGIRYRFPGVSFEFNWINKFNQIHDRVMTVDKTEYRNNIYYKSQTFCLGTELYYDWFGIGASIDWNRLVMKKEKSTERVKEDWLIEGGLSNHFFLNFEFNMNDAMAFSIRPFVQVPLYKNDFHGIEARLNPDLATSFDPNAYKQKIVNWGIKLLFVNGTKSQ